MNVDKVTYYYPFPADQTMSEGLDPEMEGGTQGAGPFKDLDLRKHTLEAFQRGESPFVAVAMKDVPYGTRFPLKLDSGKEVPAMVVDTGGGLRPGTQVDVATENPNLAKGGGSSRASKIPIVSSIVDSPMSAAPLAPMVPLDVPNSAEPIPDIADTGDQIRSAIGEYPKMASQEPTEEAIQAANEDQSMDAAESEIPAEPEQPEAEESRATTQEEQQTQDGHVPPPIPNKLTPIDHVSEDGNMVFFKDSSGTILDKAKKVLYYNDPAGNMWAYGPSMEKPIKVKAAGKAADMPVPPIKPGQSVEDALKQLSVADQERAKMFANYDMPAMTRYGRENPNFARLLEYAKAINPNLDPREYQIRYNTKTQYTDRTPTKPGGRILAFNQALAHLGHLYELSQGLPQDKTYLANRLQNIINQFVKGEADVPNFNQQLNVLSNELARAFKGGVPDQGDIQRTNQNLNASQSRAQMQGQMKDVLIPAIEEAVSTLDNGYKATMKQPLPDEQLIFDNAKAALAKMGVTNFAGRQISAANRETPTIRSQAEFDALPSGQGIKFQAVGKDGKLHTYTKP